MDRAMPTEKAGTDGGKARVHPPTNVMERATPDVKPKGSGTSDSSSPDNSNSTESSSGTTK
jgi:hypothetical protein